MIKQCLDKELPSIIRDLVGLKESEICSDKLKAMMAWLIFYFARSSLCGVKAHYGVKHSKNEFAKARNNITMP